MSRHPDWIRVQGGFIERMFWRSLCEEGYTVLISSHILSDLADMCSNIGVIHQGKMVLEGPIDEIMTSIDSSNPILIEVYQNLETAVHLLNRHRWYPE